MTIRIAKLVRSAALGALVATGAMTAATAQQSAAVRAANEGRLGLLTANSTGTAVQIGDEISRTIDGRDNLRVVQYLTTGSQKNLRDLMNFRFADMAMINSDVLIAEQLSNPNDQQLNDIKYIARVFTNELHVVVREDSGFDSVYDLSGRNISIGENGSGTSLTSRLVLRALQVNPRAIELPTADSLAALKRGELDAVFLLYGKPNGYLTTLKPEDGMRLLEVPLTSELAAIYRPAEFTADDYPALVTDKLTESIAVDVVLAIEEGRNMGLDDKRKITNFIRRMADNVDELEGGYGHHPKWAELSFDIEVPRWQQSALVEEAFSGEAESTSSGPNIFDVMMSLDQ